MSVQIITPYINEKEIENHYNQFWEYDIYYERDDAKIGSDLMFQKMWDKFPDNDIFILHADMFPYEENWLEKVIEYVNRYPEAGILGCLLLYPAQNKEGKHYIQSAGGKFTEDGRPDHFGSGLIIENNTIFKDLEVDTGQYNSVREVAWTTFGGCYIRRSVINDTKGFSADFEWTYNRDVDLCLRARSLGYKIYQIPVRLLHHESRDNKVLKNSDNNKLHMELRNLKRLQMKWANSKFYKNLDNVIKYD
jgi:GT2 family glycosyltransferase